MKSRLVKKLHHQNLKSTWKKVLSDSWTIQAFAAFVICSMMALYLACIKPSFRLLDKTDYLSIGALLVLSGFSGFTLFLTLRTKWRLYGDRFIDIV